MLFAVNIAVIALAQAASAETYDRGDMGLTVREIQTRLADWGYEPGAVDGVYGADTEAAVRRFQAANGLEEDGRAGPATLAALGLPSGGVDNAYGDGSGELELLARLISAEARGEPYVGQVAVGAVVLNRVEHPSFPNSIAEVIFQPGAFSCMLDGQWDEPIADSAWAAAREAMNGSDPSGGAICYFNPATATSAWIWSRPELLTIGNHRFCA